MNLNSIRAFFEKGNRNQWFVFTLFCLILFIKTMIFHFSVGFGILVSSLWKLPSEFFMFWGGKFVPILFLGSFVFITKKQWWTIVVNVLVDLWAVANLFYFKANNLFMSVEVVLMADNLNGFWDSLYTYLGFDIFSFSILTIVFVAIMLMFKTLNTSHRKPLLFVSFILLSLIVECIDNKCFEKSTKMWEQQNSATVAWNETNHSEDFTYFFPFGQVYYFGGVEICLDYNIWISAYIKRQSIISYLPATVVYYFVAPKQGELITLSDNDLEKIKPFVKKCNISSHKLMSNIVFILFESLESWPIYDVLGYHYLPNIENLSMREHVIYCEKLISQTKHGNSADGQMINITGILPILNGATCRLYGYTYFPNYAHFFDKSAIFNPAAGMWQQSIVTKSYQFKDLIEPKNNCEKWGGDEGLLNRMTDYVISADSSFCILGITVNSHCPFTEGSVNPVHVEDGMPPLMSAYLNCLHYTDSCIGKLLDTIFNSHLAENTTIVITGDHTIFRNETAFSDLTEYAQNNGIDFKAGHTFTPLIIYSPEIEGNIHVTDTCYQMDVFPTILNLIGEEDYFWHGFGVNVMDSMARHNRPITEQEAYRLSDLMIRSDYFRNYYGK